jgi:hypothetical protein
MVVTGSQTIGALNLDHNKNIVVQGGYDALFSQANSLPSVLQGAITIKSDSLRLNEVNVKH